MAIKKYLQKNNNLEKSNSKYGYGLEKATQSQHTRTSKTGKVFTAGSAYKNANIQDDIEIDAIVKRYTKKELLNEIREFNIEKEIKKQLNNMSVNHPESDELDDYSHRAIAAASYFVDKENLKISELKLDPKKIDEAKQSTKEVKEVFENDVDKEENIDAVLSKLNNEDWDGTHYHAMYILNRTVNPIFNKKVYEKHIKSNMDKPEKLKEETYSWDHINNALTKMGMPSKRIADILIAIKKG